MAADPKLVVALEARLNKFENQMKDAGLIAGRAVSDIEDKFSKANPSFGPTFLGTFLGNIAGQLGKGAIDAVTNIIGRFRDLEKVAKLAGASMQDVFGLQEVGSKAGASVEEVTKGVRDLAVLIDQMQRGEKNSLTKLFDANPEFLKGVNRDTLTWQQTMEIVADLIRNAKTEVQKIDIAAAAGQAESMVKPLEKGAVHLRSLQKAAADAAPDLQRLANLAEDFDKAWAAVAKNIKAYIAGEFVDTLKDELVKAIDLLVGFLSVFKGPLVRVKAEEWITGLEEAKQKIEAFTVAKNEAASPPRESARSGNRSGTQTGTTTRDPNRPLSNAPSSTTAPSGQSKDAFERQTDTIYKHIAAMEADAEAAGQGAGKQAELRAEAALTEAVLRSGVDINDQLAAKITEVATAAGKAAEALEKARDRAPLAQFARDAANLDKQFTQFALGGLKSVEDGFADVLTGTKSVSEAFRDMANSIIRDLIKIAVRQSITGPIASALSGTGGPTSILSSLLGPGKAAGGPVSAGVTYPVGEKGVELFTPNTAGTIIPNNVVRNMGSGGSITVSFMNDFSGADGASEARIFARITQLERNIPGMVSRIIPDLHRRSVRGF